MNEHYAVAKRVKIFRESVPQVVFDSGRISGCHHELLVLMPEGIECDSCDTVVVDLNDPPRNLVCYVDGPGMAPHVEPWHAAGTSNPYWTYTWAPGGAYARIGRIRSHQDGVAAFDSVLEVFLPIYDVRSVHILAYEGRLPDIEI